MSKDVERDKKCGIRLQNALNECRVEQKEMAADLHYAPTYISDLCTGKRHISEKAAKKFADYLSKKHEPQGGVLPGVDLSKLDLTKMKPSIARHITERLEMKSDYYDYRYFTGEFQEPNAELCYVSASAAQGEEDKRFSSFIKTFLQYAGYDCFVDKSIGLSILRIFCTSADLNMRALRFLSERDLDNPQITLRQLSTGKEITLSLYESALLLNTLRRSAGAILDGLFLSRSAAGSSSENAPDLGKT